MRPLWSAATITAVGLTCKAFLNVGLCSVTVNALPKLLNALCSEERNRGQGVLTIANHISTLDDPVMWGILPARHYLTSRMMRWTLGASDIMFTNHVLSGFFRHGQVIETFRGKGVYQPALDTTIQKLNQGDWIHIFPESKVMQPSHYTVTRGLAHLARFKWGVGRIIMESSVLPVVIPIWLTGFDKMMPEGRSFPLNYIPRLGIDLSITFGNPIPSQEFETVLSTAPRCRTSKNNVTELELNRVRSEVTAVAQRAVEALGRTVSGDMLGTGGK